MEHERTYDSKHLIKGKVYEWYRCSRCGILTCRFTSDGKTFYQENIDPDCDQVILHKVMDQ